ncbi:glycosyltransferase [Pedobacter sp. MR2016-24]|uniref:glycosyltransferase n=1 Tax=Pedobacter sp. MR2016-24 TaxID=2994466 RepID=UPI002246DCB7|nr:glycosyltransferase [Pedobacter sp. MR2016-24]MCX2482115.1 glycosyltransferase [Pedobacter sp. MR2016-24]
MKKIKVVEAVNQLGLGGTEYALQLFSKFLDKDLFDISVVAFLSGGERVNLIEALGIKVIVINGDYDKMAEILRETDVFHWHGNGLLDHNLFNIIRNNRPKVIIQTNVFGLYEDSPFYDLIDYDLYISKMILVRRMNLDRNLQDNFISKRKVLPYPVDVDHINSLAPDDNKLLAFKNQHNLNNYFIIGRVGRADDQKFDLITLDGFASFSKKVNNARFLLIGITPRIRKHAEELGISEKLIIFDTTSNIQELLYYYKTMDVFLAASQIGESFGMVMAEAMTVGTPVVTISTEERDNAQIEVVDNEQTGLVVKRNKKNIAAALMFLYNDKNKHAELSAASKLKIDTAYKAQKIVESLEHLILSHLQIPVSGRNTLITPLSKDTILDYHSRCANLYGKNRVSKWFNLFLKHRIKTGIKLN